MIELLEDNKLVTKALQKWFTKKMKKAVVDSKNEELIEHFIQSEISVEKLAPVLEINPRSLFDFFDKHEIYILPIMEGDRFSAIINGDPIHIRGFTKNRIDAEVAAVEEAFPILEKILEDDKGK